jgi:hypothetical protein
MSKQVVINPLSVVPLSLDMLASNHQLASATGFLVSYEGDHYLITNWHVVAGKNAETGEIMASDGTTTPDAVGVWYHSADGLGIWKSRVEALYDPDTQAPKWIEHPAGRQVDVVALPVSDDASLFFYPLDLSLAETDMLISPSEPVSIIGFPLGQSAAGKFPIWKTGHVASDIDLDYQNKPVFLIDATTKPAMSGSPVVAKRVGMVQSSKGINMGASADRLLGVYSGRTSVHSDVGMVWKPAVLEDILQNQ